MQSQLTFAQFQFDENLNEGLDAMRFYEPTPIQVQAIPIILEGKDLIACAQTGTGKTAAFLLPILHKLCVEASDTTNTLVVVPTRELALQIDQALQGFAYFTSVNSIAIYGGGDGSSFETEKKALTQGANIIIATPGRLLSHLKMNYVKFNDVKHFILDEADKMLDMGFVDDIKKIASYLPSGKQTIMFSATMPVAIRKLAKEILHEPAEIAISISKPAAGIKQSAYVLHQSQKLPLLVQLLKEDINKSVILFSSTKQMVKDIDRQLKQQSIPCAAVHSDLEQNEREEVMRLYRAGKLKVLIATDVLSRGIDIDDIALVINVDVPNDAEDYVHRVGRTARAGNVGEAITLINETDQRKFGQIEAFLGNDIEKIPLPAELGEAPTYNPTKKFSKPPQRPKRHFNKHRKQ